MNSRLPLNTQQKKLRARIQKIVKTSLADDFLAKQTLFNAANDLPSLYADMTDKHLALKNEFITAYLKNQEQEDQMVYLVTHFSGLNLQDAFAYTGRDGSKVANLHFERLTGISYPEYRKRRIDGEDNNEVLSEDDEGTEIYVLSVVHCAEGCSNVIPKGGIALWNVQRKF